MTTATHRTALDEAVEAVRPAVEALERDREAERGRQAAAGWEAMRNALQTAITAELGVAAAAEAMEYTARTRPPEFAWDTTRHAVEFEFDGAATVTCIMHRAGGGWSLDPYRDVSVSDAGPACRAWWHVRGGTAASARRYATSLAGAIVLARLLYDGEEFVGF